MASEVLLSSNRQVANEGVVSGGSELGCAHGNLCTPRFVIISNGAEITNVDEDLQMRNVEHGDDGGDERNVKSRMQQVDGGVSCRPGFQLHTQC